MPEPIVTTVTELNNRIKNLINEDAVLRRVTVKGEISNLTDHRSGHLYFTLKDAGAVLKCAMFRYQRTGQQGALHNGDQVEATGRIDVYPPSGQYQLICSAIKPQGMGDLYGRFLQLRSKLEEEGLFSEIYKKEIPARVMRLGVITAATGAAVRDIINVSKRRNPYIQIILYPALVQGDGAPESLIRGLREMAKHHVDCIIIGRGGGSIEDLWAFNDELLAREIFNCEVPVISAVGHETDFTIADFVADLRAPTPSAAAELAVFEYEAFATQVDYYKSELMNVMLMVSSHYRRNVQEYKKELQYRGPQSRVNQMRQRLDQCTDRLEAAIRASVAYQKSRTYPAKSELGEGMYRTFRRFAGQVTPLKKDLTHAMTSKLSYEKNRLLVCCERLNGLSPLNRIKDGYGYLSHDNGKRIFSTDDTQVGDLMQIYLSDGRIGARVETVDHNIFKTEGQNNGD